jgi:hypothetical protein
MAREFKFELGEVLKDVVTGFEGVVMARTQYYTDCDHYGLLSQKLDKESKPQDYVWFDETRLQKTNKKPVALHSRKPSSGSFPNAPTRC